MISSPIPKILPLGLPSASTEKKLISTDKMARTPNQRDMRGLLPMHFNIREQPKTDSMLRV